MLVMLSVGLGMLSIDKVSTDKVSTIVLSLSSGMGAMESVSKWSVSFLVTTVFFDSRLK